MKPSLFQPSVTGQRASITAVRSMWSFLTPSSINAYYLNWTYDIRDRSLDWIKAFLTDRTKVVSINGTDTLIPDLLSLVYPRGPSWAQYYFYSLSTTLQITLAPICAFSQTTVSSTEKSKMTDLWQLSFNITKCHRKRIKIFRNTVLFCHDYLMNGQAISKVTSTKYLGITLNQKLNWNQQHCDLICSKANGTLGFLRRVLGDCTTDVKCKAYIYITLFRPQLENASSKRNINKIEMVQHRATRFVLHDYSRLSQVIAMINQLGWDTLEQRRLLS